jgi:hypothetical protein
MSNAEQSQTADNAKLSLDLPPTMVPRLTRVLHNGASDTFSRDLLTALLRFRDGDFHGRLPADLLGVEGKVADVSTTSSR